MPKINDGFNSNKRGKWSDGIHINKHGIYWINLSIPRGSPIPDGMLEFEPLHESYYKNGNDLGCKDYAEYGKCLRWNSKLDIWIALDVYPCQTNCKNPNCFSHKIWYRTRLAISENNNHTIIRIQC